MPCGFYPEFYTWIQKCGLCVNETGITEIPEFCKTAQNPKEITGAWKVPSAHYWSITNVSFYCWIELSWRFIVHANVQIAHSFNVNLYFKQGNVEKLLDSDCKIWRCFRPLKNSPQQWLCKIVFAPQKSNNSDRICAYYVVFWLGELSRDSIILLSSISFTPQRILTFLADLLIISHSGSSLCHFLENGVSFIIQKYQF